MSLPSFTPRLRWSRRLGTLVAALLIATFGAGAWGQIAAGQADESAAIHAGSCADLNMDPVHSLTQVRLGGGANADDDDDDDVQAGRTGDIGGANVEPVAFSETEIDGRIDSLVQQPHVVVIWDSADRGGVLACGEIGGFPVDDDDLAFGLEEQNGSGYYGIAFLDNEDDDNEVEVKLYLVSPGAMASAGPDITGTSDSLAGDDNDDDDHG